ncbi:hypothetical protein IMZ31_22585 (plasmid) [Pontibacillus sp. ALD_SL1]|uniref:hypothetical protein n=1 Tax=Pontibacillus sp. ALD_SL1 TaxID=2777185 RepID=UPI001A95AD95|nr:hypothetical protein [Pontibacillus sp. ALD_SL1]QST02244.1 hypothetical protein IMZ31_22585 [Pontibacillus sp. ALD_SL1]
MRSVIKKLEKLEEALGDWEIDKGKDADIKKRWMSHVENVLGSMKETEDNRQGEIVSFDEYKKKHSSG